MSCPTPYELLVKTELTDILEEFSEKLKGLEHAPTHLTLEDLEIGGHPIGAGEFLDLKKRIEDHFGIIIEDIELPQQADQAKKITVQEIIDLIVRKTLAEVTPGK